MSEEGSKEIPINHGSNNKSDSWVGKETERWEKESGERDKELEQEHKEFESWLKEQEEKEKQREQKLAEHFQKINKIKEKLTMSNPEKSESTINHESENISGSEKENPLNRKIDDLINPREGKALVTDISLLRLARLAKQPRNQTPERLEELLKKGDDWYAEGRVSEEEWSLLAGVVEERMGELESRRVGEERKIKPDIKTEVDDLTEEILSTQKELRDIETNLKPVSGDLTDEEQQKRRGLFEKWEKARLKLSILTGKISAQQAEGLVPSGEKFPDIREIGPEEFKKMFREKVHALMEEYSEQSFETNWTLVWPLQQAINSLWPKEYELDQISKKDGSLWLDSKSKPYLFSELRKELADQLEAYRSIHNFRFIYKRVPGVGEAIGAASLLETRFIDFLLKDGDGKLRVSDVLKKMEIIGERHKILDVLKIKNIEKEELDFGIFSEYLESNQKLKRSLIDELKEENERLKKDFPGDKERIEKVIENLKAKYVEEIIKNQEENGWQGKVAGALYSALGRAWFHNVMLNGSGDFFCGRLFNMPSYVKKRWEKDWGRKPFPEFYQALDLRVSDFWDKVFDNLEKSLSNPKDPEKNNFKKKLKDFKVREIGKNSYGKRLYSFADPEMDFSKIDLSQIKGLRPTELQQVVLDLEEADHIRKRILNPKGLVDEPGLQHINGMYDEFKHLVGKKRSEWMREVIKQIIWFFKDRTAPDIESLPKKMRDCPAKEVFPEVRPWLNQDIILSINSLTPPLTPDDAEIILTDTVGPKSLRELKRAGKIAAATAGAVVGEIIKSILGIK